MREIIFDTETTGLDNRADRVIEIGCVELENHFPTGRTFHEYICPQDRKVHPDALAIHGITDAFLADKPKFGDIAPKLVEFFGDAKLIAHNAMFDIGFLNSEFARIGIPFIASDRILDSLALARRRHPMGPNSLDALCRRYGIDNSNRDLHGALLDARLLADVYIEMIGGRQTALSLVDDNESGESESGEEGFISSLPERERPLAPRLSEAELAAHTALIEKIGGNSIWLSVKR